MEQKFSFQINDTVAIIVSPAADLNREKVEEMVVLLKVTDSGGNSDTIVVLYQKAHKNKIVIMQQ